MEWSTQFPALCACMCVNAFTCQTHPIQINIYSNTKDLFNGKDTTFLKKCCSVVHIIWLSYSYAIFMVTLLKRPDQTSIHFYSNPSWFMKIILCLGGWTGGSFVVRTTHKKCVHSKNTFFIYVKIKRFAFIACLFTP